MFKSMEGPSIPDTMSEIEVIEETDADSVADSWLLETDAPRTTLFVGVTGPLQSLPSFDAAADQRDAIAMAALVSEVGIVPTARATELASPLVKAYFISVPKL
jgi:hypothetical protein